MKKFLLLLLLLPIQVLASLDYTITTATTGLGAGAPSKAISITLTGTGTLGSDATFTMSDGGASGTFYLRSTGSGSSMASGTTTKIASGGTVGAVEQFVYVPASGASGNITLTATASGGLTTGPYSVVLSIATASKFVNDTFTGTVSTDLGSHTPDLGSTWSRSGNSTLNLILNGSGGAGPNGSQAGDAFSEYMIPTAPASNTDYDVVATQSNVNTTKVYCPCLAAANLNNASLTSYALIYDAGWALIRYSSNIGSFLFSGVTTTTHSTGDTVSMRLSIRTINSLQYVFAFDGGTLLNNAPTQNGDLTSGYAGTLVEYKAGQTPAITDNVYTTFYGENADWSAATDSMTAAPTVVPKNHSGNITITLSGTGTFWVNGVSIFTLSGVTGVTKISQNVTSSTSATVVLTTDATHTGTLTITESVTGVAVTSILVSTATLSMSPSSGTVSSTPSVTFTGANTVWSQETASTLFSVSGGTGSSIGSVSCSSDTSCTATLTSGSASAILTLTDNSVGNTTTFSIPLIGTFPNANIFLSPYTWRVYSGNLDAPTGGAYMKGVVSGTTSISFNVDTTGNVGLGANDMPSFKVTIDGNAPAYVQEAVSATTITLASGLTTGSHTFLIQVIGGKTTVGDGWAAIVQHTIINSIQFDPGSVISAPTTKSKNCLFFGDSYLMSVVASSQSGAWYNYIDFTQSWPVWVANAFGCEFGQEGIGSTGWKEAGNGSFPAFPSWWDHYDSTHTRDLTIIPNYLVVAIGVNDHVGTWSTSQIDTAMNSWHTAMRATTGWASVPLFIILPSYADPSDNTNHAQIKTSALTWADPNAYVIDVGSDLQSCLPFTSGTTACSFDSLHPTVAYHGWFSTKISQLMQLALIPPPSFSIQ